MVFIEGEEGEVGRVSKLVYFYLKDVSNGYGLAKKDKLKIGDQIMIHGTMCVTMEKNRF